MGDKIRRLPLNVFLLKDDDKLEFGDCIKQSDGITESKIKEQYGLDGMIYYCPCKTSQPSWKECIDDLAERTIRVGYNTSNKAVIIVRIKNRLMALVFGYGRSMLKEELIERNFGLKVCLNIIDESKLRSINAVTIEDMVVTTQKQASYSTSQNEFDINTTNDIIRAITGAPYDNRFGKTVSGKDSISVSIPFNLTEITKNLESLYNAFSSNRYKEIGFEWIDNVYEVRDSVLKNNLVDLLCEKLKKKQLNNIHIAPPEIVDWEHIEGFYLGSGKKTTDYKNYTYDLSIDEYADTIKPDIDILNKLRRESLYAWSASGQPFSICSVLSAIVCQLEYTNKNYILSNGSWYEINSLFFDQVNRFIDSVPLCDRKLPNCLANEKEGDYNERVTKSSNELCLMDKKLKSVLHGPTQIEVCDIFTKTKQLICIKNRGYSAQLSHLFAQGRVSADCFLNDKSYRHKVYNAVKLKLGNTVFNYEKDPAPKEFEIVYGIIYSKDAKTINEVLPFFSKVNLMQTCRYLKSMRYKYSVCIIKKE